MANQKIPIPLKPYDYTLIHPSAQEILQTPKPTPPLLKPPIPFPTKIHPFNILPSPHLNKTSPQQFQIPTHFPLIHILHSTHKTTHPLIKLHFPAPLHLQIKLQ
ncbi:30S ribosomal protein S10 [Neisseria sicca]|uniref:30S ribosomal protein S10 n=1 Tax=Neisseria sicca TaxID=490 RepID=UPI0011BD19A2|nr:30S ribosomal protein S10 [Neisseria sicca]